MLFNESRDRGPICKPGVLLSVLLLVSCTGAAHDLGAADRRVSPQAPHPVCPGNPPPLLAVADLTETLLAHLDHSYCVYNPAVLQLRGDVYLYAARTYRPVTLPFNNWHEGHACVMEAGGTPQASNLWHGEHQTLLAVVRHSLGDSPPSPGGGGVAGAPGVTVASQLLAWALVDRALPDPRLLYDDRGQIWLYSSATITLAGPRMNTVAQVHVNCSFLQPGSGVDSAGVDAAAGAMAAAVAGDRALDASAQACRLRVGASRLLLYARAGLYDKNWVPWNGTTRMTYTAYPAFAAWHEVLHWGNYEDPPLQRRLAALAERQPLFEAFHLHWGELINFSGGTPAVLEPGGKSWLAVAHAKAHAGCFHAGGGLWSNRLLPLGCAVTASCDAFRAVTVAGLPPNKPLHRERLPIPRAFNYRPLATCSLLNTTAALAAMAQVRPVDLGAVEGHTAARKGLAPAAVAIDNAAAAAAAAQEAGGGGGQAFLSVADMDVAAVRGGGAPMSPEEERRRRRVVPHHKFEYLWVLYRFSASPPYTVTHVSPGFMPPTAVHSGVVFPLGLSRIAAPGGAAGGPQHYLVSYGEDDMSSHVAVMSEATVQALLRPVGELVGAVPMFPACTLPAATYAGLRVPER